MRWWGVSQNAGVTVALVFSGFFLHSSQDFFDMGLKITNLTLQPHLPELATRLVGLTLLNNSIEITVGSPDNEF